MYLTDCKSGFFLRGRKHLALLILQPFHHFTYITTHSPTLMSLYPHHSSFSNPSVASPTSQLILQHLCHFTYITAHSPTLPLLHLCHSSFSKLSVTSPTSHLILQTSRCFIYVTAHSPNPSFASPTSQALHLRHLASNPCYESEFLRCARTMQRKFHMYWY